MHNIKKFLLSYHVAAIVGFKQWSITVRESEEVAVLTVTVMGAELANNAEVIVNLTTTAGTANG